MLVTKLPRVDNECDQESNSSLLTQEQEKWERVEARLYACHNVMLNSDNW